MFNILKILLLGLFLVSIAEAKYVRKVKEPDFFIPEKERLHKPEKLPPIQKIEKIKVQSRDGTENIQYTSVPVYKTEYNQYLTDVIALVNSGKLPENKRLEKDLADMSGTFFEVKEPIDNKLYAKEQKDFLLLADKIIKNKN